MFLPAAPKYQWGQRVRALIDLYNDGSYPDQPPNAPNDEYIRDRLRRRKRTRYA